EVRCVAHRVHRAEPTGHFGDPRHLATPVGPPHRTHRVHPRDDLFILPVPSTRKRHGLFPPRGGTRDLPLTHLHVLETRIPTVSGRHRGCHGGRRVHS